MNQPRRAAMDERHSVSYYCISVRAGCEELFRRKAQELLERAESGLRGTIILLKKRMRLKRGKEYDDLFFPGYLFLETEETDSARLRVLSGVDGFYRFLPENKNVQRLRNADLDIVKTILKYGGTVGIIPAEFDKDDRIVLLSGPFRDLQGKVIAVNRRNRRVNIQLDFMNGARIVDLSYEEVRKAENTETPGMSS